MVKWRHNAQWWLEPAYKTCNIHFPEIKDAFARLGLDNNWAVVTSFSLNTFDDLYRGELPFERKSLCYIYKGINIYHVPAYENYMIVMRADRVTRYEA